MRLTSALLSLIATLALPASAGTLHDRLGEASVAAIAAEQPGQLSNSPGLRSGKAMQQLHASRHIAELARLAPLMQALVEAKP
ncbi:hypothetical protein QWZ03_15750 [Chitinimonas viridis]|uniref:DUF4142 domain-containing protein n=1 Tax=Chitinimonas viridis TaxID=664880 RepID=A0ABT8B7I8_9NEIS|nr:hypothetical protein [Chitinimonas viridis]MDN3578222.1 hypothetical protein [Chitinimonas viridis]